MSGRMVIVAPRGTSIHIGVDTPRADLVEPLGRLPGAHNDATAMAALVRRALGKHVHGKLPPAVLLGSQATMAAVGRALDEAAATLRRDDLLVLTFAGHADQIWERVEDPPPGGRNRVFDENDMHDEAWFLWDGVLLDDEVAAHLARFAPGVRIFALADTCHAGSSLRGPRKKKRYPPDASALLPRRDEARRRGRRTIEASVLFIPACTSSGFAYEAGARVGRRPHGELTAAILDIWERGVDCTDHVTFHRAVQRRCYPGQVPAMERLGKDTAAFAACRPFAVGPVARSRTGHRS